MQKLNVITRTSGRPNFFKFCKNNIDSQLYPHLNHVVIIDEKNDNSYVNDYPNISAIITIPKDKYTTIDSTSGNFIGMDAYLNDALETLPKNELFCVMDDDDFYIDPSALTQAVTALEDGELIFFRVRASTNTVPYSETFSNSDKTIKINHISMLGFIMSTNVPYLFNELIRFKPRYGGDFYFINDVVTSNYPKHYNSPKIK